MTILYPNRSGVTENADKFKRRLFIAALGLSLLLHSGAVLLVIMASGFGSYNRSPAIFSIQDISLSPAIHAPMKNVSDSFVPLMENPPVAAENRDDAVQSPVTESKIDGSNGNGNNAGPMSTPLGLGMTHGYFSSLADGKTLRDDIREYYFELVAKINRGWWDNAGSLKDPLRQDGAFELLIKRDGSIEEVRVLQSTGSQKADLLMIEVIRSTSALPPLPASYNLDIFRAPVKIKAPSPLFR